jgi:hypothetical protein
VIFVEQGQKDKIEALNTMWKCISRQFAHGPKTNIKERAIKILKEEDIEIHEALYMASEEICVGKKKKHRKTEYAIFSIVEECK